MKVTVALLDTRYFLDAVEQRVNTKADRNTEVYSKRKVRIKRFAGAASKAVSVCSSPSSESPPTDTSDDGSKRKDYYLTSSDGEECQRRKMKDLDGLKSEKRIRNE